MEILIPLIQLITSVMNLVGALLMMRKNQKDRT